MRRSIWLTFTAVLACTGCDGPRSVEGTQQSNTSASSQHPAPAPPLGALATSASASDRRASVYDLFAGGEKWKALPERATDHPSAFDPELASRLAPSRNRVPRVKMPKGLKVTGELPSEVVERVVSTKRGKARLCYDKALKHDRKLKGRVAVTLQVGQDGGLSTNSATGDAGLEKLADCIKRSFFGTQFPAPKSGTVSVHFTIEFVPHE